LGKNVGATAEEDPTPPPPPPPPSSATVAPEATVAEQRSTLKEHPRRIAPHERLRMPFALVLA
jgi:hypothetical protein